MKTIEEITEIVRKCAEHTERDYHDLLRLLTYIAIKEADNLSNFIGWKDENHSS